MGQTKDSRPARVLAIGGSDSGGGAGIQADIKTVFAFGGYAMTAVTAVTAQDTTGVHAIHAVPANVVREQIACVLADIGADAIKTGMLGSGPIAAVVADALEPYARTVPVVVDPVMIAKGGAVLMDDEAMAVLVARLLPLATVVTPNAAEAARLTGLKVENEDDLTLAGRAFLDLGAKAALMKGGHLPGEVVTDVLVTREGTHVFRAPRLGTRSTHGTGCTLASAIAVGLGQNLPLAAAVARAHAYVQAAIRTAPGLGCGHGPLNHAARTS